MLGLQAQRFVGQQQFPSSGWPKVYRTRGSRGWWWCLSSNPAIKIQEVSCVPNTPNTTRSCIGALVRRRDGKIWVIGVAKRSNINLNKKHQGSKWQSEHKQCNNGEKQGLGFILSLVTTPNNINIIKTHDISSKNMSGWSNSEIFVDQKRMRIM